MARSPQPAPGDRALPDDGTASPERDAVERARGYFLDDENQFGCAETAFIVLKEAFGLDGPQDSSAAVALNGGIAYGGGPCGALTGAALAVGMLAEQRIDDHARAKRVAREIVARTVDEFVAEHGSLNCRDLIRYDLRAPGGHDAFIASGIWRTTCMGQVGFVVARLARLANRAAWDRTVREIETTDAP